MVAAALVCVAATLFSFSATPSERLILSPEDAHHHQQAGELTIVDVRRPNEWRQTGLPTDARRATFQFGADQRAFMARIKQITGGDKTAPIALICATGIRSSHAAKLLRARGYRNVSDIRGGVLGNAGEDGWLKRDLPVSACPNC